MGSLRAPPKKARARLPWSRNAKTRRTRALNRCRAMMHVRRLTGCTLAFGLLLGVGGLGCSEPAKGDGRTEPGSSSARQERNQPRQPLGGTQ